MSFESNSPFPCQHLLPLRTRREMLRTLSCGFGWLAFSSLANAAAASSTSPVPNPLSPKPPHFTPRAKRVLFLCMRGGPSHVDTFDYKPKLQEDDGKPGLRPGSRWLGSKWTFKQHGQSGLRISDLFPNLARHADRLCLVNSMHTDVPAHPQAFLKLHTGNFQFVRPSLGAWTLYGLGTENENLPGFVTISPPAGFGGAQNFGSAFLPAICQGTRLGSDGRSVERAEIKNLKSSLPPKAQRAELDYIQSLNRAALRTEPHSSEIEGVIESFELAFRMQSQLPGILDLSGESEATQKLYGLGVSNTEDFGLKCLQARRLLEGGVRFVEITHGNWDQHFNLSETLTRNCAAIDLPLAGLLTDLHQRSLLQDTLVVWSGEFGRTPYAQGTDGRDHNHKGFSLWMAGGGVRGGITYGRTDDHGYEAVENKVHIHDLHATMLHLLGLDHEKLTCRYAGRDFRLTDVHGHVVRSILA